MNVLSVHSLCIFREDFFDRVVLTVGWNRIGGAFGFADGTMKACEIIVSPAKFKLFYFVYGYREQKITLHITVSGGETTNAVHGNQNVSANKKKSFRI